MKGQGRAARAVAVGTPRAAGTPGGMSGGAPPGVSAPPDADAVVEEAVVEDAVVAPDDRWADALREEVLQKKDSSLGPGVMDDSEYVDPVENELTRQRMEAVLRVATEKKGSKVRFGIGFWTDMNGTVQVDPDPFAGGRRNKPDSAEDRLVGMRGGLEHEICHELYYDRRVFEEMVAEIKADPAKRPIAELSNIMADGRDEWRHKTLQPKAYEIIEAHDALEVQKNGSGRWSFDPGQQDVWTQVTGAMLYRALPYYRVPVDKLTPEARSVYDECAPHVDAAVKGTSRDVLENARSVHEILKRRGVQTQGKGLAHLSVVPAGNGTPEGDGKKVGGRTKQGQKPLPKDAQDFYDAGQPQAGSGPGSSGARPSEQSAAGADGAGPGGEEEGGEPGGESGSGGSPEPPNGGQEEGGWGDTNADAGSDGGGETGEQGAGSGSGTGGESGTSESGSGQSEGGASSSGGSGGGGIGSGPADEAGRSPFVSADASKRGAAALQNAREEATAAVKSAEARRPQRPRYKDYTDRVFRPHGTPQTPHQNQRRLWQENRALAGRFSKKIEEARVEVRAPRRNQTRGSLDRRRMRDAVRGQKDVYVKHGQSRDVDMAVELVLDVSGSMLGSESELRNSAATVSQGLDISGIPHEVRGFSSPGNTPLFRAFGEKPDWRMGAVTATGGTDMSSVMPKVRGALAERREQSKLAVVFTDGATRREETVKAEIQKARKEKINVLGVYFAPKSGDDDRDMQNRTEARKYLSGLFGKDVVVIDDVKRLPEAVGGAVVDLIKRGKP